MRTVRSHQYVSRDTIHRSGSLESDLIITYHEFLGKTGVERVPVLGRPSRTSPICAPPI